MTQTISARTGDKLILDEVAQFLATEYGMQVADMRIGQISGHSKSGGCTLNIDVNDDEADDIRTELLAIGVVMDTEQTPPILGPCSARGQAAWLSA